MPENQRSMCISNPSEASNSSRAEAVHSASDETAREGLAKPDASVPLSMDTEGLDTTRDREGRSINLSFHHDTSEMPPSREPKDHPEHNMGLMDQNPDFTSPENVTSPLWSPFWNFGFPYFDLGPFSIESLQGDMLARPPENPFSYQNIPPARQQYGDSGHGFQIATLPCSNETTASSPKDQPQVLRDSSLALDIPSELVKELIDLYFDKIHSFLSLFHRPRFLKQYIPTVGQIDPSYNNLSLESSLILNGIFALAARFSSSPLFGDIPPAERGRRFGQKAKALYEKSMPQLMTPTLHYLQGLILLAFYLYSTEPDPQGWLLIGTCSRLAYELGLNNTDESTAESQGQTPTPEEWSKQEELRRAGWCIWELDAFAAAIACRPPTIDKTKMQVMLPVSDKAWFTDTPVKSAVIDADPVNAWRTLEDCPNQDARAWFLLSNFLLLLAHDLGQKKKAMPQEVKKLEDAVACFALVLPSDFHVTSSPPSFKEDTCHRGNWIISINIMLEGCRIFLRFISANSPPSTLSTSDNHLLAPLAAASHFQASTADYYSYAEKVFTLVQLWDPAYISVHTPFIGCLIIGPAAINLRVAIDVKEKDTSGRFSGLELDLLIRAIRHIARFWRFGSILLEFAYKLRDYYYLPE